MYLVVAYMSSGQTSCRGCVMDSWDSQFDTYEYTDAEDAAKVIGGMLVHNVNTESFGEWEIHVYYLSGVSMDDCQGDQTPKVWQLAHKWKDELLVKIEKLKVADAERRKKKAIQDTKAYELKLLAELKAKHESCTTST